MNVCARIIHDESFPRDGVSLNSNTDKVDIEIQYDGPRAIAQWAIQMELMYPQSAVMMKGDVSGAFRNLHIHADSCGMFAGYLPRHNRIVVHLTLPFGWTDSPAFYWIAGGAIHAIHNSRLGFDTLSYCDDHMLMQAAVNARARAEELSLRRSMILVLGTRACNEKKFTTWARQCTALGLTFCFDTQTVSMPPAKITKAVGRLLALLVPAKIRAKQLREALGLLRHVGSCVPAARPFFNRLQARECVLNKVGVPLPLGPGAAEDVHWLVSMLKIGGMNGVPWSRFAGSRAPDCYVNMDASDWGVCGVWHERKQYFAVPWDEHEKALISKFKSRDDMSFSINIRELLGGFYSLVVWIDAWSREFGKDAIVRFVIDNTSAVCWTNSRTTSHPDAQAVLRIMSLMEAAHHLQTSAEHVAGVDNVWADLGSRQWTSNAALSEFELLNVGYEQVAVGAQWRRPSECWDKCYKTMPCPEEAMKFMTAPGGNGASSVEPCNSQ